MEPKRNTGRRVLKRKAGKSCFKPEWGFQNLMVLAAFRYCLGRRSYIVGSCVEWIIQYWNEFDPNSRKIILKEIKEALENGHAGDECDIDDWKDVLKLEKNETD